MPEVCDLTLGGKLGSKWSTLKSHIFTLLLVFAKHKLGVIKFD